MRRRPAKTLAKLAATGIAPAVAVTAHNMASEEGRAFYEDMEKSGKEYILDSNLVIVLPWASKNEQTGEWDGVIRIPVAPELRGINKGAWRNMKSMSQGEGMDAGAFGAAVWDTITSGTTPVSVGEDGIELNRSTSNPAVNLGLSLTSDFNYQTGERITPEEMRNLPKDQQVFKNTGGLARLLGKLPGLNPLKAQTAINQFGSTGRMVQSAAEKSLAAAGVIPDEQVTDSGFMKELKGRFTNVYGDSKGTKYYKNVESSIKDAGLNQNEKNAFLGVVVPSSKDAQGNEIKERTYWDTQNRATTFKRYPKVFEAAKKLAMAQKEEGSPVDPLYKQNEKRTDIILNYMSESFGSKQADAMVELNPWMKDFFKERSKYYDKVKENIPPEKQAAYGVDPAGFTPVYASKEISKKLQKASKLEGKEKGEFYANNPDIFDYFAEKEEYDRAKRAFMKLPQFDKYPKPDKQTKEIQDFYNSLPKNEGANVCTII